LSRNGSPNIPRDRLLGRLVERPQWEADLAAELGFKPESVRRRLQGLSRGKAVREAPGRRGLWELGDGAGFVLTGAVGSSRINASVFDPYLRALSGLAMRKSELWDDAGRKPEVGAIVEALARTMREALDDAGDSARKHLRAIAFALPYNLDSDTAELLSGGTQGNARDMIIAALEKEGVEYDWDALCWKWASDIGFEGVFEYHLAGGPQRGASPLFVVKLSRDVRASTLIGGQPLPGARGDVADLGELRTRNEKGEQKLSEVFDLRRLYRDVAGIEFVDDDQFRDKERDIDAKIFGEDFSAILRAPDERGDAARAAMAEAGEILGACLDGPITAVNPAVVVITGFLTRDQAQLRDGILSACRRHRHAGVEFVLSSGIEAEEVRRDVVDTNRLRASPDDRLSPRELPHQYRIGAGAAKQALNDYLAGALGLLSQASGKIPVGTAR
jgi:predicted NBD/HSP70 family sugar kinase